MLISNLEKQVSESVSGSRHVRSSDMAADMVAGLALAIQFGDLALCKSMICAEAAIPPHLSTCDDCSSILHVLGYSY